MTDPAPACPPCVRVTRDGVVIDVSVVPGAARTEAVGLHGDALRVRLAAPPVEGRANDALVAWLAEQLGVPRRAVSILRGHSGRRKQVAVDAAADPVVAWVRKCVG